MSEVDLPVLLNLYSQIAGSELFRLLQRNMGYQKRTGIYTARVVIWMMIAQRLDARGTLASAVEKLVMGELDVLLSRCKRVQEKRIGVGTGGYCQARQDLPKMLLERSVQEIVQRLRNRLGEELGLAQQPVYVLDGSSLQLECTGELKKAYRPAHTQYGESHWPLLRIVVLQDVETGFAEPPCWGAMCGKNAVSEQALAQKALCALPPGGVIIGDRNFGIFSVAQTAHQNGHRVILRLTTARATRVLGRPPSQVGDYSVQWQARRWDQCPNGNWPEGLALAGRLIVAHIGRGKHKQWLYLFTTLTEPAAQVVAWYGKRWNVETDLRSLKQTMRLQRLSVQSVDMMEKELLAAVLAYNLVRAVMAVAATRRGLHPRQLSFTYAYNIVEIGIAKVLSEPTELQQVQRMDRIIDLVGRSKLPRRSRHRTYPRAVWGRGGTYPRHEKTK